MFSRYPFSAKILSHQNVGEAVLFAAETAAIHISGGSSDRLQWRQQCGHSLHVVIPWQGWSDDQDGGVSTSEASWNKTTSGTALRSAASARARCKLTRTANTQTLGDSGETAPRTVKERPRVERRRSGQSGEEGVAGRRRAGHAVSPQHCHRIVLRISTGCAVHPGLNGPALSLC